MELVTIQTRYWTCHPVPEQTLARFIITQWNGVAAATPAALAEAMLAAAAPGWSRERLEAFVGGWDGTFEQIPVEGLDIEFVVFTAAWVTELIEWVAEGGGVIHTPTCTQAVGFPGS